MSSYALDTGFVRQMCREASLPRMPGALCDRDNAPLQRRSAAYKALRHHPQYDSQMLELKAVRGGDEQLEGCRFPAERRVLRRLDKTLRALFVGLTRAARPGFPRSRAKRRFNSAELRVMPGGIGVRRHRRARADARVKAAVSADQFNQVGIRLGLPSAVALPTGDTVPALQHPAKAAKALRRAVTRKRRNRQRKSRTGVRRLRRGTIRPTKLSERKHRGDCGCVLHCHG